MNVNRHANRNASPRLLRPNRNTLSTTLLPVVLAALLAGCASAPNATKPAPTANANTAPSSGTATSAATQPNASVSNGAAPSDAAAQAQGFARWVERFRTSAKAAGITDATLDAALADVQFLPQVVELDRAQPEFTRAVWDYLDTAVSAQRVTRGQDKLLQVRAQADAASARYGVPATVLAAIWGMESNYGSNYGNTPTIDALATLGFEGRREEWARGQLIAAMKIVQNGDIDRTHMIGSWAGAMGQTQFLPSNFLAYAVDADGDGRRDIWGSMADVFASTANFLARSGWVADEPWGVEVALPAGFDFGRTDTEGRQSSAQWAAEGVRTIDASPLPTVADAMVLLPAGARGPAFLVGRNFRAILRYNNSNSYALGVSLLSQRLAGGPGVAGAWPRDLHTLTRSQLRSLQTNLNQRGFDTGNPDGMMGPATRAGIRAYQRSQNLPADGYPTLELLQSLQP